MIHKKSTFFLGIFIFLIPFLGLPSFGKTTLIILSGLTLIGLSVKIILPKQSIRSRNKRTKTQPVVENKVETIDENQGQPVIE